MNAAFDALARAIGEFLAGVVARVRGSKAAPIETRLVRGNCRWYLMYPMRRLSGVGLGQEAKS